MNEDLNIDELEYIQSGGPTEEEMDKLDGYRVKIANSEVIDSTTRYTKDENGNQIMLPEDQAIAVKKIELTTEEFGEELIGRPIIHKEKYNLKSQDGRWVVSLHEKANTAKFLAKYKVDTFKNAKGVEIVLSKKTNPETKKSRLHISI